LENTINKIKLSNRRNAAIETEIILGDICTIPERVNCSSFDNGIVIGIKRIGRKERATKFDNETFDLFILLAAKFSI